MVQSRIKRQVSVTKFRPQILRGVSRPEGHTWDSIVAAATALPYGRVSEAPYSREAELALLGDLAGIGAAVFRGYFPSEEFVRRVLEAALTHGNVEREPGAQARVWATVGLEVRAHLEALRELEQAEDAEGDVEGFREQCNQLESKWLEELKEWRAADRRGFTDVFPASVHVFGGGSPLYWLRYARDAAVSLEDVRREMAKYCRDFFGMLFSSAPSQYLQNASGDGEIYFFCSARCWAFMLLAETWGGKGHIIRCLQCGELFRSLRSDAKTCPEPKWCRQELSRSRRSAGAVVPSVVSDPSIG